MSYANHLTKPASRNASDIVHIDSNSVGPLPWTKPDECEFEDMRFEDLKNSINAWGGNIQPVKLRLTRPITPRGHGEAEHGNEHQFEIVFGYARHRACLELGFPVLAMTETLTDVEALQQFAVEIRGDARWRPWRLSRMLCSALGEGLFPSVRRAADAFSIECGEASLLQAIGRLPESVRLAYRNLDLTPLQATKLVKAYSISPQTVVSNSEIRSFQDCLTAASVLATLIR